MTVTRVCYCSRDEVQRALDFKDSALTNAQIDRAMESAARNIEGLLHRKFYPVLATRYFDWPNYQYAYPWRIWFDQHDLVTATAVTSGGQPIPLNQCFFEPVNSGPPFTYLELDRSTTAAFGVGPTPQRDVAITGTWGYSADTDPAGSLAAAVTDTTGTTLTVTDSSAIGVGNTILIDTERFLVTGQSMVTTGQAQQGSGVSTTSNADVTLAVTSGAAFTVGEILLLDSERMLIVDIAGNNLTVKRPWDGTVIAAHTSATIYAPRQLTVTRGALGTTAATHSISAPAGRHRVPSLIRDLAIGESLNSVLQETSGYARTVGAGDNERVISGAGLADKWYEATAAYGRKNRTRVI